MSTPPTPPRRAMPPGLQVALAAAPPGSVFAVSEQGEVLGCDPNPAETERRCQAFRDLLAADPAAAFREMRRTIATGARDLDAFRRHRPDVRQIHFVKKE